MLVGLGSLAVAALVARRRATAALPASAERGNGNWSTVVRLEPTLRDARSML